MKILALRVWIIVFRFRIYELLWFWEIFVSNGWPRRFFSFIRACLHACVCGWVRYSTWAHLYVRTCVHMHRGMSDSSPSIIWVSHTTLLQPILFKSWAETSELLGQISSIELNPQAWHWTNNRISLPFSHNSPWGNLYPPSTPHFTCTAHLPHPLPKSARLWGVYWHRACWRLLVCTLRTYLQTV